MTDTAPALFDRLADRYDQVIPFFAAVDAAPRMAALLAADHPWIDVRLADARLPAASYDLAAGGFVIHLAAEPLQVLAGRGHTCWPSGLRRAAAGCSSWPRGRIGASR
jgi:hypothetical protein